MESVFDTLCFGSGGVQGIMYMGAVKYLVDNNYINLNKIENYCGTSIGSIVAFFYSIGYDSNELIDIILNHPNLSCLEPDIDLDMIENEYGMDSGNAIVDLIREILKKKLDCEDITFIELYNLRKKKITINATNLNTGLEKIFNYIETPDVSVVLAVRMSISLPIIYTPVLYNNEYYIDGAVVNKLLFKHCNFKSTLSFKMKEFKYYEINSFQSVALRSLQILLNHTVCDKNVYKIIDFQSVDFSIVPLSMSREYLEKILKMGEDCSKKYYLKELKKKIKLLKLDIENDNFNKKIKDTMNKVLIEIKNIVI